MFRKSSILINLVNVFTSLLGRSGVACGGLPLGGGSREPARRVTANAVRLCQPWPAAGTRNQRSAAAPLRVGGGRAPRGRAQARAAAEGGREGNARLGS